MKTKSKILLTSMMSIAFASSLIAGSTYALFTSKSEVNIAVTSGKVKVNAEVVENFKLYSLKEGVQEELEEGVTTFVNGGTVSYNEGALTLDRMTPGDKVEFDIKVTNESNVAIKYRTILKESEEQEENSGLLEGLKVVLGEEEFTSAGAVISSWKAPESDEEVIHVSIELPEEAGNEYQDKASNLVFSVEAVQGNADIADVMISNASDLMNFANKVNAGDDFYGKTIKLASDIDLSGAWAPIGAGSRSGNTIASDSKKFSGTFDGKGYTISGLSIGDANKDVAIGLFGIVSGGTVKNLTVNVDLNAPSNECAGGVVGLLEKGGTVENVTVNGEVSAKRGNGGVVGRVLIDGNVTKCTNNAIIKATGANAGGIAGAAYYSASGKTMTIKDCVNNGSVTSSNYSVGGIVGLSAAEVENCTNTASVIGKGSSIGGIVGEQQNYGFVKSCVNTADITNNGTGSSSYGTGGIIGWVRYNGSTADYGKKEMITVDGNTNYASIISSGNDAGGIVGTVYNTAMVVNNKNYAKKIQSGNFAAGIVGNAQVMENPAGIDWEETGITVGNNISTTSIESIVGTNKHLYVYDNSSIVKDKETNTADAPIEFAIGSSAEFKAAIAIIKSNGEGKVLLTNDIELDETLFLKNVSFTLDGNNHTITQSGTCTNNIALLDISGGSANFKNVTFDGIKGGAVIRTVYVDLNVENVTVENCEYTKTDIRQGLLRLLGKSTIINSTFKNNDCSIVVSLNIDASKNDAAIVDAPQIVKDCVFEGNECSGTAALYYVDGAGATIDGNKFMNNSVNNNGNAATVYVGFTENNVITNNVFLGNTVTTTHATTVRASGGLMVGYEATIKGNCFVDNKVIAESNGRKLGNDVCASVYYTDIDLSGNYWGGHAPVKGDDYYAEYDDKHEVIINDYLYTYSY